MLNLDQVHFIVDIDPGCAVVDELRVILFITLVHGFAYLVPAGVVILYRERLCSHQVPDDGELRTCQGPEPDQNFRLCRHPCPVHFPVQRAARIRRVNVEGLEGKSVLGDILNDVCTSDRKSCSCQVLSLPLLNE